MKIWCQDFSSRGYTDAGPRDASQFSGVVFHRGRLLSDVFPHETAIAIRGKKNPNDFFAAGKLNCISPKLKELLESFQVEAEYFPVPLTTRTGKPLELEWYCVNFTRVIDWFDRAQSRFAVRKHLATDIVSVVAHEELLTSVPLAVALNTVPILVAVSDALAEAVLAAGCTGVLFRKPRDWQDPVNPIV